ncbi:MAG: hypothetical protein ACFFFH_08550 [Candidatus Thorarchaeota archaeon]
MSKSLKTDNQGNEQIKNSSERFKYWDRKPEVTVYPQIENATFTGFVKKIVAGMTLTLFPAVIFAWFSGESVLKVWGIAIFLVSGIYFVVGGCSDLSQTSAKKSFQKHMDKIERTQNISEGFKFDLKTLKFGKIVEDIGAAISLLALAVLISTIAG